MNAQANLYRLGQPNTFLVQGAAALGPARRGRRDAQER
jgi:hypothetical protein